MGANQSMPPGYRGGPVKLRRRSTGAAVTADELASAGVDITRAVAQNAAIEAQRAQAAQEGAAFSSPKSGITGIGAAEPGAAASTAAAVAKPKPRPTPATIELPPWEVVANLSDTDWFALRNWLEAGWRCRKCGNMRDDHGDHPKAVRLLAACGVVPPALRRQGSVSPSPSGRSGLGPTGVEYASASPDHQVGYLSDSSPGGSFASSPASRGAAGGWPSRHAPANTADASSPRFGQGIAVPDHAEAQGLGVEACPHLNSIKAAGGASDTASASGGSGTLTVKEVLSGAQAAKGGGAPASNEAGLLPRDMAASKWDAMRLKVLHAISRAQQVYFIDKEPNGSLVFDFLLSALLDCTNSGYGFISSALLKADGSPYLKTHAMSNVAWTKELRAWYAANAHKGLVFTNMNTLHGSIVLTGQPVITNNPSADPRAHGVPPGHPGLESFMGVPLYTGTELIGIYGLANRKGDGYSEQMMKELEPLTLTVAQMIYAVNERKRRKEAELHLASVVQVAKEGILSMSHSGHVTSMNHSARAMFGLAKEGDRKGEDIPPPHNLLFQDLVLEVDGKGDFLHHGLEHQSGNVHVAKGRRMDGSVFPLEASISRGTYDTVFFVAVLRDMSEQIDAAHKLQESEERWQYQVSGLEDGVWDWNVEHNTFFFSPRWFQNLGYEQGELSTSLETWNVLIHPDDKEAAYTALKDHMDGLADAYSNEHRLKCKDGSYKWFAHRGRVVHRSEEGEPVHFVGTHFDISDRKRLQATTAVMQDATHDLLQLEAEHLATAAIDMHGPAVQIVESAGELGKTELSAEQKEHVDTIGASGQKLVSAVQGELGISDIEADRVALDYHAFSVAEVVETAVCTMSVRALAKGLETVIETAPDTPLFIVSDAARCMEVVISLLSAAILETSRGYVRVRLGAEMVFPQQDDDEYGDSGEQSMSMDGPEDVLYGRSGAEQQLHGPQLHLVITVDGTGSSAAALSAADTIAIQTPRKLLPILGGSLGTMIDSRRGAIYTAKIPVNLHHPEYKAALAMRAAKPLRVREPLLHTRVLVVGSTQVTMAAIGKQLNAWHIPHAIVPTTPELAFLKSFPEGRLPGVVLPTVGQDASYLKFADGTPRTGVAAHYDIVIVDFSIRAGLRTEQQQLQQVVAMLGRDKVGVVVLTRAHSHASSRGPASQDEDALALFVESEGGHWVSRKPVLVRKPMVRPSLLLAALEDALRSLPGNSALLPNTDAGADPLLLGGSLQKRAAKQLSLMAPMPVGPTGPKLKGRVLLAEHNAMNVHTVELVVASKGGVQLDSCATLEAALQKLRAQPYDLVFLDVHLPDMGDPYGVVHAIGELEGQTAEVIVMKQQLQKAEQDRFAAAGATGCISRPLTTAQIEHLFQKHLTQEEQ